jgi:uncharacterized protein YndB with AHSA1/START domain
MSFNVNVIGYIGAVIREVRNREYEGKPARVVTATRTYNTDIDDLWEAITSPERIPRWFMPIQGDLRLGGRYQLIGNAGGTIKRCEPPRFVAVTWEFGGGMSWVEVSLSEDPKGGTRLELEHIAHLDDTKLWDQFGPGAVGVGWDLALMGLGLHIERGGQVADHAKAEAWMASPEGKDFVRRSSEDWCRASIAFGTDKVAATEAAKRTTAFYTGEAAPGGS